MCFHPSSNLQAPSQGYPCSKPVKGKRCLARLGESWACGYQAFRSVSDAIENRYCNTHEYTKFYRTIACVTSFANSDLNDRHAYLLHKNPFFQRSIVTKKEVLKSLGIKIIVIFQPPSGSLINVGRYTPESITSIDHQNLQKIAPRKDVSGDHYRRHGQHYSIYAE
jgi:hypothetical protein